MDTEAQPKSITVLGVFINNKITEYGTNKIFECLTYGRIREVIEGKLAYLHLITNEYGDMRKSFPKPIRAQLNLIKFGMVIEVVF